MNKVLLIYLIPYDGPEDLFKLACFVLRYEFNYSYLNEVNRNNNFIGWFEKQQYE